MTDWDTPRGGLGAVARFSHDHYYLAFAMFISTVASLSLAVLLLPAHELCVPGNVAPQMQVCKISVHAWNDATGSNSKHKDALGWLRRDAESNLVAQERTKVAPTSYIIFNWRHQSASDNSLSIFSPRKVQAMCQVEALVLHHPLYPLFCPVDAAGECAAQPYSVAELFYSPEEVASGNCPLLSSAQVLAGKARLSNLDSGAFFVSAGADPARFAGTSLGDSNTTRSILSLGAPLKGFASLDEGQEDQDFLRGVPYTLNPEP